MSLRLAWSSRTARTTQKEKPYLEKLGEGDMYICIGSYQEVTVILYGLTGNRVGHFPHPSILFPQVDQTGQVVTIELCMVRVYYPV